jgi:Yip1-like protein
MTDVSDTTTVGQEPPATPGLMARIIGVLFSPRPTYAAVAAKPRSLGVVLVVILVMGIAQGVFLSSELGQKIALDTQIKAMESFGVNVTDQMYDRLELGMKRAAITTPIAQAVFLPIVMAIEAGVLLLIFSLLMGGAATFKHVYAVVAHSSVIVALQQVFTMALSFASGKTAGANLGIFVPMLEEKSVVTLFLGSIDLFYVWATISLAIGLGVLYKRSTGAIATTLLGIYVVIALVIAFVRSGS